MRDGGFEKDGKEKLMMLMMARIRIEKNDEMNQRRPEGRGTIR